MNLTKPQFFTNQRNSLFDKIISSINLQYYPNLRVHNTILTLIESDIVNAEMEKNTVTKVMHIIPIK